MTKWEVREAIAWVCRRAVRYTGWAIVRTIEACWVALHWLDPRFHSAAWRLRAVAVGGLDKHSDRIALFVIYAHGRLPDFTRSFIEAVNRSPFDLVIVSNGELDAAAKAELRSRCRLFVERANVGRDFGGYKDGIALISERIPELRRLMIANDSVFYLPAGLDALVAALNGDEEFIGVSEIFEHRYHVASFLASFGPAVLGNEAFRRFWQNYRPVGTRRWAIMHGEHALTTTLVEAGFRPHVLFRIDALRDVLTRCPADRLMKEAQSLPVPAQRKLSEGWRGSSAVQPTRLAEDIAATILARNQMHYGGFLFRRHLGLPVVKRDLVYRDVYPLPDALGNLSDLTPPLFGAVAADLRARRAPGWDEPLRRLFHRYGAI